MKFAALKSLVAPIVIFLIQKHLILMEFIYGRLSILSSVTNTNWNGEKSNEAPLETVALFLCSKFRKEYEMEQEKLYVIEEKTYEAHIDEEVHLYGLLHQLAFLAGKIKDRRDMENLIDTARRYGEIADQMFDRWSIPGRYLVFGDKADLARLKALELCELDAFYVDCEDDEDQPHA